LRDPAGNQQPGGGAGGGRLSIAGTETNIDQVSLEEREWAALLSNFSFQVRDRKHLARVIKTIRRMPDVHAGISTLA